MIRSVWFPLVVALALSGVATAAAPPELVLEKWWAPTIHGLSFSPDGGRLAAVSNEDGAVRVWSLREAKPLFSLRLSRSRPHPIAFSPDSRTLVTADLGKVQLWDARTGQLAREFAPLRGQVLGLAFRAGGLLAVESENTGKGTPTSDLRLWNLSRERLKLTARLQETEPLSSCVSRDGSRLVVAGADGSLRTWDIASGRTRWDIRRRYAVFVGGATLSHDDLLVGQYVAVGGRSHDGEGKFWRIVRPYVELNDSSTGALKWTLPSGWNRPVPRADSVPPIAFSPDGMAAGDELWDVKTGMLQRRLNQEMVTSQAFHPYGRLLALGSGNGKVRLWDAKRGRLVATLMASSDGEWLASTPQGYYDGSADLTSRIRWRVGHDVFPAERYAARLHRPNLVRERCVRLPGGRRSCHRQ